MKKILAIVLLFSLQLTAGNSQLFCQHIDTVEYFFDIDPGAGNGNKYAVALSDSVTDSVSFSFPGLTPGFHTLNFRVRDTNGVWSLYESRTFFLNDTNFIIQASFDSSSAEYFFNSDPGPDSATALLLTPGDSIMDTAWVSTAGLAPGFHSLYLRIQDSNDIWSLYQGANFYLYDTLTATALPATHPLGAAEYFFNTDTAGVGSSLAMNAFTPADSILLTDTLPAAMLTAGTHYLYVRTRDTLNIWSHCERKSFIVCNLIPIPDFTADTVCVNTPTTFTDLSSNLDTNFAFTYGWDFDNDSVVDDTTTGNTNHTFQTSGTHTVSLIVNNTNGCVDTVIKTVYVDSLPTATLTLPVDTICKDDTLMLTGGSPAGGVYSGNGVYGGALYCDSISGGTHKIYYTYYNSDSCSVTVNDLVYVSNCTGIDEYGPAGFSVNITPNPFQTNAELSVQGTQSSFRNLQFALFDVFGKEIQNLSFSSQNLKIERGNLTAGIYMYKVIGENGNYVSGKLIVVY